MSKPMFHLNPLISSSKKVNRGFGLFIKEGVATPGYEHVAPNIAQQLGILTQSELRKAIIEDEYFLSWEDNDETRAKGATQIAMWLKNADVGSFIIMLHHYPNCEYCPKRLKVNGDYIGPVYAIGMVTKQITPWSEEEAQLSSRICEEEVYGRRSNLCRVDWRWLGKKNALERETQNYLSKICQSTVTRICQERSKPYKEGGTPEAVRKDLWKNAVTNISSLVRLNNF